MRMAIVAILLAAAFSWLSFRLYKWLRWLFASRKQRLGRFGEEIVAKRLRDGLPSEYEVINHIYLPLPSGGTTEIDHVVVSRYGIFVIETKTCSGILHCSPQAKNWRQKLVGRNTKMPNPLEQNAFHARALSKCLWLPHIWFRSIVAVTGEGTMIGDIPPNMMYSMSLADYILGFERPIMPQSRVKLIADAIRDWQNLLEKDISKQHIAYVRQKRRTRTRNSARYCAEKENML